MHPVVQSYLCGIGMPGYVPVFAEEMSKCRGFLGNLVMEFRPGFVTVEKSGELLDKPTLLAAAA